MDIPETPSIQDTGRRETKHHTENGKILATLTPPTRGERRTT